MHGLGLHWGINQKYNKKITEIYYFFNFYYSAYIQLVLVTFLFIHSFPAVFKLHSVCFEMFCNAIEEFVFMSSEPSNNVISAVISISGRLKAKKRYIFVIVTVNEPRVVSPQIWSAVETPMK